MLRIAGYLAPLLFFSPAFAGEPSELLALMEVLRRPYDEQPEADPKYSSLPPPEMAGRPGVCVLSCSS